MSRHSLIASAPTTRRPIARRLLMLLALGAIVAALLPLNISPAFAAATNAIVNGGFENGTEPWAQVSSGGRQLIRTARPYRGTYSALLGNYNAARDALSQTFTVPADGSLVYVWYMVTRESGTTKRDVLRTRLLTTGGQLVANLHTISNLSSAGAWHQRRVSLAHYAGQTLRLEFLATTNSTLPTTFFVDNVMITVPTNSLDAEETELLRLINQYRQEHGVGPLTLNTNLVAAADWLSKDSAAKNYTSHIDSLGRDPYQRMDAFGYTDTTWRGENIVAGFGTAAEAFAWWKASPSHNENMLRSIYVVIGIGRAYNAGSQYGWYWTTDFGAK
jgi:uncharacterized protein YkwD